MRGLHWPRHWIEWHYQTLDKEPKAPVDQTNLTTKEVGAGSRWETNPSVWSCIWHQSKVTFDGYPVQTFKVSCGEAQHYEKDKNHHSLCKAGIHETYLITWIPRKKTSPKFLGRRATVCPYGIRRENAWYEGKKWRRKVITRRLLNPYNLQL